MDGSIIEAEYLGEGKPGDDEPTIRLAGALRMAISAEGPVVVPDLSATSIRLQVDQEVSSIDDEFDFTPLRSESVLEMPRPATLIARPESPRLGGLTCRSSAGNMR